MSHSDIEGVTIQDLINALEQMGDKTKKVYIRDYMGDWTNNFSVTDVDSGIVEIED